MVEDAHTRVQRMFSGVKMATVLEEYTTEKQHEFVRFLCGRRKLSSGPSWRGP
jgi:hypothetical protein